MDEDIASNKIVSADIGKDGAAISSPIEIDFPRSIAPSQDKDTEYNTIKDFLVVVGCCTVPDEHFEFDSSFVTPEAKDEMIKLARMRDTLSEKSNTGEGKIKPPISIFGHADPVGEDLYNIVLSQRRSAAIYGMLIRDVEIWQTLFDKSHGGDKWGNQEIKIMQDFTCIPPTTGPVSREYRAALILAYMDAVCVKQDAQGKEAPYVLDKEQDFLARGRNKNGKGDVQGCGEFNPAIILSDKRMKEFAAMPDKEQGKEERNKANRPNRRVIAYLFKPGSDVDSEKWPCPHVRFTAGDPESYNQCKSRLWYKWEERKKSDKEKNREFRKTEDTFACRFYHGIAHRSPCEGIHRQWVLRVLLDTPREGESLKPLANRRFVVKSGQTAHSPVVRGRTDDHGMLRLPMFDEHTKMELRLDVAALSAQTKDEEEEELTDDNWQEKTKHYFKAMLDAGALRNMQTGELPETEISGGDKQTQKDSQNQEAENEKVKLAAKQRLYNLGYGHGPIEQWDEETFKRLLKRFQQFENLEQQNGELDEATKSRLAARHEPAEESANAESAAKESTLE